jgi:DnaJ-class molecular chaperone
MIIASPVEPVFFSPDPTAGTNKRGAMSQIDYYQVIGVSPQASQKEIKEAFRQLALKYHPDRNPADGAERMKAVNEAYAVLSNPQRRAEYDTLRQQFGDTAHTHFRSSHSDQDIFRGSDIDQIFEELARSFGLRGVDEIFRDVYGPHHRHFEFRRPGMFARGFVFVGGRGGRGRQSIDARRGQRALGHFSRLLQAGLGRAAAKPGRDLTDTIRLSPEQARQGGPWAYTHQKRGKKLVVKIPPGVGNGQRIRLAGMGLPGRAGGPAGDLYLKVAIRRSLWQRIKGLLGRKP